jgi:hypothetical protein
LTIYNTGAKILGDFYLLSKRGDFHWEAFTGGISTAYGIFQSSCTVSVHKPWRMIPSADVVAYCGE